MSTGDPAFDEVAAELADFVEREAGERPQLDADLVESGILDSMAMVLLVAFVEERFDLDIDIDALGSGVMNTVRSAAQYIIGKSRGK